jgi:hypothetical protein
MNSVWYSKRDEVLALAGSRQRIRHNGWLEADSNAVTVPWCSIVRGTAFNNIWWAGDFSFLMHFNGKSWKQFRGIDPPSSIYSGLAVGEEYLFASGVAFPSGGWPRGIVIRGYAVK